MINDLYTDLRIYQALFKLRSSDSTFASRDSPPLNYFGEALSGCNDAVRSAVAQISSAYSLHVYNPPTTPLDPPHCNKEDAAALTALLVEQRTNLTHSFVILWIDSLQGSFLIHAVTTPLPISPVHPEPSAMQSDTSSLPPSKPSRSLFEPPSLPTSSEPLDPLLSAALITAEGAGKQWAARMEIEVEKAVICFTPTRAWIPLLCHLRSRIFFTLVRADDHFAPITFMPVPDRNERRGHIHCISGYSGVRKFIVDRQLDWLFAFLPKQ